MDQYQTYYTGLRFERAGLFEAILKKYQGREVLYPGCSIHITPSFFFPHVLYVDKSELAERFFADEPSVLQYINRHKHYRRSAYIRFIKQDYSQPLPLREGTFDLLLGIFASGISKSCKKHLKRGGLLISNNHQNEAVKALKDDEYQLISTIQFQHGQYLILESGINEIRIPVRNSHQSALQQNSGNPEYYERETYYVFEKIST